MFNDIPACVFASAYKASAVSVERYTQTDEKERFQFAVYRNGLVTLNSGFESLTDALNAEIAQVDSDVEEYQSLAA